MKGLGLVVRCDNGGLGAQLWEAWRHLKPERTMLLDIASSRGVGARDRFPGATVVLDRYPQAHEIEEFVRGLSVVFGAECWYTTEWTAIARAHDVDCVLQANPELFDGREANGSRVVLPTAWEACRVPHERILPVPIATDRFATRAQRRERAAVFYHVASPAMADRNGTALLLAALRHVRSRITVIIRGARPRGQIATRPLQVRENVTLLELDTSPAPYFECWPDADALLIPRRYGGLSLPMQEAAALGMPIITTALEPQHDYPHAVLVPVTDSDPIRTKGGVFSAWRCDPRELAAEIDALASQPHRQRMLSDAALDWANEMSWARLLPEYESCLSP